MWLGFEIAIGLVFGVIVTIRVLMFLRLVKYRRGSVRDAPADLRNQLMRENLEVIKRKEGWDKETLREITTTLAHIASSNKVQP